MFTIRNVKVNHPSIGKFEKTVTTYRTYFSTKGEQKICLSGKNVAQELLDTEPLEILYDYPWWGVFRKPAVMLASLLICIVIFRNISSIKL
jgi:hypothetical protein